MWSLQFVVLDGLCFWRRVSLSSDSWRILHATNWGKLALCVSDVPKWFSKTRCVWLLLSERWYGEVSEGGGGEDSKGNHSLLFPRGNQLGSFDRIPQVQLLLCQLLCHFDNVGSCILVPASYLPSLCYFPVRLSLLFWLRLMAAGGTDTAGGYWSVCRLKLSSLSPFRYYSSVFV